MSLQTINAALKFCNDNGLRVTEPRRYVLEIIARSTKPMGAYDILQALGAYFDNPKPPTAYRAIEFWQKHGLIHRIESLNAYIACSAGHTHKGSQYLICQNCGRVEEIHICTMPEPLSAKAAEKGFKAEFWNVEIHGVCKACQ